MIVVVAFLYDARFCMPWNVIKRLSTLIPLFKFQEFRIDLFHGVIDERVSLVEIRNDLEGQNLHPLSEFWRAHRSHAIVLRVL